MHRKTNKKLKYPNQHFFPIKSFFFYFNLYIINIESLKGSALVPTFLIRNASGSLGKQMLFIWVYPRARHPLECFELLEHD